MAPHASHLDFGSVAKRILRRHPLTARRFGPSRRAPADVAERVRQLFSALGVDSQRAMDLDKDWVSQAQAAYDRLKADFRKVPPEATASTLRRSLSVPSSAISTLIPHSWTTLSLPVPTIEEDVLEGSTETVSTSCVSKGSGTGAASWFGSDADEEHRCTFIGWNFIFVPAETHNYSLRAWLSFVGHYILLANDTIWTSKEAWAKISVGATMLQPIPTDFILPPSTSSLVASATISASGEQPPFFAFGDDNIDMHDLIGDVEVVSHECEVLGGIPAGITIYCILDTFAKGAGSIADLDFSGPGDGISCPILRVY